MLERFKNGSSEFLPATNLNMSYLNPNPHIYRVLISVIMLNMTYINKV